MKIMLVLSLIFGLMGCSKVAAQAVPFDVPAKEWDGPEMEWLPCKLGEMCMDVQVPVHHVSCEDKRRVLLADEAGAYHCYAFYTLGAYNPLP